MLFTLKTVQFAVLFLCFLYWSVLRFFIKIDVEGNEKFVLEGGKKTTENTPVKNDTPKTVKTDNWIARLQAECNAQGFSKQAVDGIKGPKTLAGCPTLKKGASGNITRLLQEKLISLGYNCGSCGADGKFGADTKNAVIAYQKKSGLSADGIVGQNTWRKLLGM